MTRVQGRGVLHRVADRFKLAFDRRVRRSFALDYLDVKLRPFLDFEEGVFVEAGGFDGFVQSNTLYFERFRNWRGLIVEPVPEFAAACRRNRPHCVVEESALVAADYPHDFIDVRVCSLMSIVKGGMHSAAAEDAHVALAEETLHLSAREVRCRARTLSSILTQHGIARIDLLSLDVEGYELQALRGLDLTLHSPAFMLIEARYRDDIDAHLEPEYEAIAQLSHHDVLYRRRNAAPR